MTEVIAHRGESWGHLENTLPAFGAAAREGVDVIELDVRLTGDGVLAVVHDVTLHRLWGHPQRVSDLTWPEVSALRVAGERIPRLEEALDLLAGSGVRLLIDVPDPATAAAAVAVAREHPAYGQVSWCGETDALRAVRQADGKAVLYLGTENAEHLAGLIGELHPAYLNSDGSSLSRTDVRRTHEQGLKQAAWTVDDAAQMRALLGLGVDAVTTNRVDLALHVRDNEAAAALDPTTARFRDIAIALAQWAIRRARSPRALVVETKTGPSDLVTDVDRAIERRVREVLQAELPGHAVVGEELGGSPAPGYTWYCDPVDGTTNYANGLPFSSFSLCLVHDGQPLVAVVADLARAEVVDAVAGGGVHVDGMPVAPPRVPGLAGGCILTELAGSRPWPGLGQLLSAAAAADATLRIMGSGALSVVQTALGRATGTVIGEFHPIDHSAACLIAHEAGCVVVDERGRVTLTPTDAAFVVARPDVAADLLAMLTTVQPSSPSGTSS